MPLSTEGKGGILTCLKKVPGGYAHHVVCLSWCAGGRGGLGSGECSQLYSFACYPCTSLYKILDPLLARSNGSLGQILLVGCGLPIPVIPLLTLLQCHRVNKEMESPLENWVH